MCLAPQPHSHCRSVITQHVVKRETVDSVTTGRYDLDMSEARDLATDPVLEPVDQAWLEARVKEYEALLQYLRDH